MKQFDFLAIDMIDHLDHLVLTTHDKAACVDFYCPVLGMTLERFVGRTPPVEPEAHLPVPGAFDLCFMLSVPLQEAIDRLACAIQT